MGKKADFEFVKKKREIRLILSEQQTGIPSLVTLGCASGQAAELTTLPHSHKGKLEIIIMLEGIRRIHARGIKYSLYSGDVAVISPNEEHCFASSANAGELILWFMIDLTKREDFLGQTEKNAAFLWNKLMRYEGRQLHIAEDLMERIMLSTVLIGKPRPEDKIKGQSLFIANLMELLEQEPIIKILSEDIDYAKEYILTHVEEAIAVDELMTDPHESVASFKRRFTEQIGMSPRDYLNFAKIEHSKKAVAETNQPIIDIAFNYHFSSSNYYKLLFKRYIGCSVAKYRKTAKKQQKKAQRQ